MIEGLHQVEVVGMFHTLTHGLGQLVLVGHVKHGEVRNAFPGTSGQRTSVRPRQDDLGHEQAHDLPVLVEQTASLLTVPRDKDPVLRSVEAVHHDLPQTVIVFDDQDDGGGGAGQDGPAWGGGQPAASSRVWRALGHVSRSRPARGYPHPLCKMAPQCRQTRASDATRPGQYGQFFWILASAVPRGM